ncbi:hypothetical protein RYX36_034545 [Vicia faba]
MDGVFGRYDGIEDDSDEDDAESSVDLLIKFLQSTFKKMSKKASRSVLPSVFSPQLVSFAVDGTLLLASLSVVKALLEVICNIGGTVFAAILILRVILAAVSHFQSSGNSFNQGGNPKKKEKEKKKENCFEILHKSYSNFIQLLSQNLSTTLLLQA